MKDTYGDKLEVEALGDVVHLKVHDSSEEEEAPKHAESLLTPKQARKLASKLLDAADLAEAEGA